MVNALVSSGIVPIDLVDAFMGAPAEIRRRCFDSGQIVTAGALFEIHPLAELFPAMTQDQYEALRDDIAENGVREPIHVYQGKILDGKHRQRACIELGIDPPRRKFRGKDPLAFVVSQNLRRRHLTSSQRAMVAATIATLARGAPKGNRNATGKAGDESKGLPLRNSRSTSSAQAESIRKQPSAVGVSQRQAGELMGISDRSITSARKVRELGSPALIEAVERGDLSVSAAVGIAQTLPAEIQAQIVSGGLGKDAARYIRTHAREIAQVLVGDADAAAAVVDLIRKSRTRSVDVVSPEKPVACSSFDVKDEWRDVSDRPPRAAAKYLVFLPDTPDPEGDMRLGRYVGPGAADWIDPYTGACIQPSHWMPKPPRPGANRHA